jgi:hypothetical protein
MDPLKPHAPHIQDGQAGNQVELEEIGEEAGEDDGGADWMTLARQAYTFSTSWFDANFRKRVEDSLRLFNNQHTLDSKYNDPNYSKRSRLFRPKTRAVIRKNEAAAAAAFFSSMEVVNVEAENQSDKAQVASAAIMKQLLQYRLTKKEKGIPWFHIVIGGLQDAQKSPAACAKYDWDKEGDKPSVKLIPIENLRFDAAADWTDVVNTSPYIIEIMPMYVCDIKDNKIFRRVSDQELLQAKVGQQSSTTITREKGAQDPRDADRAISDYEVVFVQRHIHRRNGQDWEFYTLGEVSLLTQPKPLKASQIHGKRNYVIGCAVLETHTTMPSSIPELSRGLQEEANEIVNQRLDNVKFVLNKRWLVARNKNVDLASLVRNVPGAVTLADNPKEDIVESNWPDVTSSAYAEQDRINADMDELLGNFSSGSVMQNKQAMESPMRTLGLLNSGASQLTEYLLRTYVETFIEPLLRAIVLLEQCYETDITLIGLAAENAQLFQKHGVSQVTDELLNQELTIKVDVGMGATDPAAKLQKFLMGVTAYAQIAQQPPAGMNINEVGKEIFGHLGYQDGKRFMTTDDPQKMQLMQKLQQAYMQSMGDKVQLQSKEQANKVKLATEMAKIQKDRDLEVARLAVEREIKLAEIGQKDKHKAADLALAEASHKMEGDKLRADVGMKAAAMAHSSQQEQAKQKDEGQKSDKSERVLQQMGETIKKLQAELKELKSSKTPKGFKVNRGKDGRAESLEFMQ